MKSAKKYILIGLFILIISMGCTPRGSLLSGKATATAYNSLWWQTDGSPWITASGTRCRYGVVASNFLAFGTKLKIDGFGDQIFVVEDRMNRRYTNRIDIWMPSYKQAIRFGKQEIKYYVVEG